MSEPQYIVKCDKCGARIVFLPTKSGTQKPCDASTVAHDDEEFQHGKHSSHADTCGD